MKTENCTSVAELFTELVNNNDLETQGLNPQLVIQLQGQVEESLGLLNDVVEELRTIAPEAVVSIKALTLKIFEYDSEST